MFDEFGCAMPPLEAFTPCPSGRMRLYKGGTGAPPPDPRLVEAQIRSMGIQDSAIQHMLQQAEEVAPLQRQQMQDSIDRGTKLYEQSQADRVYGLERRGVLTGIQDRIAKDAAEYSAPGRQEELAGEAQADVTASFDNAEAMQRRGLERQGVAPGSGRYASAVNMTSIGRATASATAANKTRQAARLEGFQLTDRANNSFAGYPASTASSVGAGLSTAGFGLNSANTGLAGMNSGFSGAGSMAGQMGQNATGMFNAQGNYKNNADKIAADSDPFNAVLGAVAGAGMSYATGGMSGAGGGLSGRGKGIFG